MGILGGGPTLPERPSRRDRRKQRARARARPPGRQDSERRAQAMLLIAIALVAVIVVGVGVFGYIQTNANKPKEAPVVRVGDRSFDMGYMERRLRYIIRDALVGDAVLSDPQVAAYTALADVPDQELDRRGAPELGISVSEEEIDADIRLQLRVPESADTGVFADAYRNEVRDSGLHPDEYREVVAARLREEKLRQRFREQIPATAEQVHLRDIVVEQKDLQSVQDRLAAGEDFGTLAAEVSLDSNKALGGDMDWQPRGALPAEVEDVVFSLEVGQVSEPMSLSAGYYLFQVLEKAADRELTTDQRQQIEEQLYSDWRAGVAQQFPVTYADGDINMVLLKEQVAHLVEVAKSEGVGAGGG